MQGCQDRRTWQPEQFGYGGRCPPTEKVGVLPPSATPSPEAIMRTRHGRVGTVLAICTLVGVSGTNAEAQLITTDFPRSPRPKEAAG